MRISSIQIEARDEPKLETILRALALLKQARGSDMIVLPEIWATGYFSFERYAAEAEPLDGPLIRELRNHARDLKAWIHAGSFIEIDGGHLFNTSVLIDSNGHPIAHYRKRHLFGYNSREKQLLQSGNDTVVADTPWGRVGLATCYDLRFPEMFRKLIDQGAQIFLVASAWPAARLEAWRLFNRTRALENQAILISCNAAGTCQGQALAGDSHIVDPWGEVVARAGPGEEILTAEIDPGVVEEARKAFPALADRKTQ